MNAIFDRYIRTLPPPDLMHLRDHVQRQAQMPQETRDKEEALRRLLVKINAFIAEAK